MKTHAQLLAELQNAVKSGGVGGKTTAEELRSFLALLVDQLFAVAPAASNALAIPTPRWQTRNAGQQLQSIPGPIITGNFVRILFDSPLDPALLALAPEIWLFTYNRRHRSSPIQLSKTSWGHPSHLGGQRHPNSAFWGGSSTFQAVTEFFGPAIQATLTQEQPHADILINANEWFTVYGSPFRARGKRGFVRRFRFALVVNAPANQPTPSGKLISSLSEEVWFSSRMGEGKCRFQAPVYTKKNMS